MSLGYIVTLLFEEMTTAPLAGFSQVLSVELGSDAHLLRRLVVADIADGF